jgi:serine/threonine protein phosphatase PrpC
MPFEHAARSHVGRKRKNNEDAMLSLPGRALWAVADGMGGHAAGDVASALVVQWLSQLPPGAGKDAVRAAIEDANQTLWEMGQKKGRTMGSTVVALAAEKINFPVFGWATAALIFGAMACSNCSPMTTAWCSSWSMPAI